MQVASKTLPQAIATMEGYYLSMPPSRSRRNNNPGDIEWGAFARAQGATHLEEPSLHYPARFAVFPSPTLGWAALTALLRSASYATLTIEQAINRYAPPVENNTTNYVKLICGWCACQPTDTVLDVLNHTTGMKHAASV